RVWQERLEFTLPKSLRPSPRQRSRAAMVRRRLLDGNPVVWLASRDEQRHVFIWTFLICGSAVAMAAWLVTDGAQAGGMAMLAVLILVHMVLSMWVASEACAVFPSARDSGSLELLLSTPITVRQIVDGHIRGLTRLVQRPLMALLVVDGVFLTAYVVRGAALGWTADNLLLPLLVAGICVAVSVMDLFAVTRYGLWAGLVSKKTGWAVSKTILIVLVIPVIAVFCCRAAWPVVAVCKNLILITYAQQQLRSKLRSQLTERYGGLDGSGGSWIFSQRAESELPPVLPR
ncbi:MAG: hypothetical protein QOF48_1991, partial [Verrucomicrobiota bacterium]